MGVGIGSDLTHDGSPGQVPKGYGADRSLTIRNYIRNQEEEDKRLEQMNLWR